MAKRNLFQLPLRADEVEQAQEIKSKLHIYKIRHKRQSLFEALKEIIEIVEKIEGSK